MLYAVPILIGVSLLTFALFYGIATPDTIARRNITVKNPSQAQIHEWLVDHGYDKPLPEQFKNHMESLLLFRFGKSDRTKQPIWDRIREGAVPSAEVAGIVLTTAVVIGLTVAMISAYFRGRAVDTATTLLCVLLLSIVYVVYVIGLQFLFGKVLRYGPLAGYQHGSDSWRFVLMPAAIGVIARIGYDVRLFRTFLLEEINQDYVRTARAKGLRESVVLFRHVLKNAMVPIVTTTVASIPLLILGSIVLETYFGIPGLGTYLQDAIAGQDFAVVRAMVYLGALLYILGLILTDLLYAAFDPRVRLE